MIEQFTCMPMARADVDLALAQAAREGWNPGRHDAELFFSTDPAGFFKAVTPAGRPVGFISAVAYDAAFGFIGLYIVLPSHRGGRIGIELGNLALNYLGARCIGQDGVFAKVKNYARYGFKLAYRNLRYETTRNFSPPPCAEIVPAAAIPFNELTQYDRAMFPAARPQFLKNWISQPDACALVYLDAGRLRGYGVIRQCQTGCKIGPLFADAPDVAETLWLHLAARKAADAPIYLDVPEVNARAIRLAAKYGMRQCFGTARMYKNGPPTLDVNRIYGVTSFELG